MNNKKRKIIIILLIMNLIIASFFIIKKNNNLVCNSYSVELCPNECVVCPPYIYCSSISCQTEKFCEDIGFDKNWHNTHVK